MTTDLVDASSSTPLLEFDRVPGPSDDGIVLVGEGNPYGADSEFALYCWPAGSAGHRLWRILGVDEDRYLGFRRVNLCDGPWDREEAAIRAVALHGELVTAPVASIRPVVLLLGVRVCEAFSALTVARRHGGLATSGSLGRWEVGDDVHGRARWIGLPHPSGLCRKWGGDMWGPGGSVAKTRAVLRELAPHVAWGETDHASGGVR